MKQPMTKIFCDACEKQITKSTPVVAGPVKLRGADGNDMLMDVTIRLGSTEPKKRFPYDICTDCVFEAVENLNPIQEQKAESDV